MLEILIEPKKSLLFWIIDLLADTARFKDINKVSVADLGMFLALSLLLSIYRFVFFVYHSTDIDPSFTPFVAVAWAPLLVDTSLKFQADALNIIEQVTY